MLTSLMLVGVQTPGAHNKFLTFDGHRHGAEHRAADIPSSSPDAEERIATMRPINVDLDTSCAGGVDVIGSPILFVTDDVLAAFDKAVDRCERNGDANDETFDFGPMHVDNATDESSRMLHVEALDPERMEAAGLFGGALAPKESGSLVELMRHREPIQIVDFYVL